MQPHAPLLFNVLQGPSHSRVCPARRVGEDGSEKLDYTPGVFSVERHVRGKWVCDDFGGYKASFELGVTEIGCMAHARRKLFELHATNKSTLAKQALRYIQLLYEIENEARDLEPDLRCRIQQGKAVPVMEMLHAG